MHVARCFLSAAVCTLLCAVSVPAQQHIPLIQLPDAFRAAREVAVENDLEFFVDPVEIRLAVSRGDLVGLSHSSNDYFFTGSFPYAHPKALQVVEEIAARYKKSCGKLKITSAARALTTQPKHAERKSMHRTGVAFDFGIPDDSFCRGVLEDILRDFGRRRLVIPFIAYSPPHYHGVVDINSPLLAEPDQPSTLVQSFKPLRKPVEASEEEKQEVKQDTTQATKPQMASANALGFVRLLSWFSLDTLVVLLILAVYPAWLMFSVVRGT